MAFNIANALQPSSFNPIGVAQQAQQNQLAQAQNDRSDQEFALRQEIFKNSLAQQQEAKQQANAGKILATSKYVLASDHPAALLLQLSQSDPNVAQFLDQVTQHHGVDWSTVGDDGVRQLAQGMLAHFGSQLGQGPEEPKYQSVGPGNSLVQTNAPNGPKIVLSQPAEETFGAPVPMTVGGKAGMYVRGNRGTLRQIPGAVPYQAPSQAGDGMQLTDVALPDGTVQKEWVPKGKSSGVAVGAPTTPSNSGATGGREATQINRMLISASQATKTLENITKIPSSSSAGIFGGFKPGTGLLGSAAGTLANAMTTQEVQRYGPIVAGLTRSLAGIEAAGLMPNGTLTHQMDAVTFKEGDTELTKLTKLAEARQIVEEGIKPFLDNPRVSEQQKKQIQTFIDRMDKAIPFTQDDVTALQMSNDKSTTINDIVNQRLRSESAPTGAPPQLPQGWTITRHN